MRRTVALSASLLLTLAACGGGSGSSTVTVVPPTSTTPPRKPVVSVPAVAPTSLRVDDLVKGDGPPAIDGDLLVVHYVGVRQADGTEFDNSYDQGEPIQLTLGVGKVIAGWDQGLVGVQQGGRRHVQLLRDGHG